VALRDAPGKGSSVSGKVALGLVCAMKEECRCVLRWRGWRRVAYPPRGVPVFERERGNLTLRLVIAGMGGNRAVRALGPLLHEFRPERVVCFGFGGSLVESLRVGDLVWGKAVARWEEGRGLSPYRPLASAPRAAWCHERPTLRQGYLVSVDGFVPKGAVARSLPPAWTPAVLEMETYGLSLALEALGIPLAVLRCVSDELELEAGPLVRRWVDDTLRLQASMLMEDLFRHPARTGLLVKLFRRSRLASRSLAMGLRWALEGPEGF